MRLRTGLAAALVAGLTLGTTAQAAPTPEAVADVLVNLSILQNNCGRKVSPQGLKAYLADGNLVLEDLMSPEGVHNDVYIARLKVIAEDLKKYDGQALPHCTDLPGIQPYAGLVE